MFSRYKSHYGYDLYVFYIVYCRGKSGICLQLSTNQEEALFHYC